MAVWKVRASFLGFNRPLAVSCSFSLRRVRASPTGTGNAARDASPVSYRVNPSLLPPVQSRIRASAPQIFPATPAGELIGMVTRRPPIRRHAWRPVRCERRPGLHVHGSRSAHETDTRRAENGRRRPASGNPRATSCKRQRGRSETRQSGGHSVPVGAAPRCRCHRGADRQSPMAERAEHSPHPSGWMRLLQVGGIRTCRS